MKQPLKFVNNLIRKRPVLAVFEVNLQCNSKCGYCDLPLNEGRYEMSRDEIKSIFTDLYTEGLRFLLVQGGEPTLRKDLLDIMQDLTDIGFVQTLVTNGTRLTDEFITRLKSMPVGIAVSLDSLDRETYRQIRGADQLNLVLKGIEKLHDFNNPRSLVCILSEKNKHEAQDIVNFATNRGFIPVVGAYHWGVDRYGKTDSSLQYKNQEAIRIFESLLSSGQVPAGYFRDYLKDNIQWLGNKGLSPCDAGRYSIAIDPSGNVAPCLALGKTGNLRNSSLSEILDTFDTDAITACSDKSSCNLMCSRVVGTSLRRPISSLRTPRTFTPV
jgi:MoaA/NifB/PqqE/SkfB family radical SAM enzyme